MGKQSKRPGRAARDVHAVIREQAAEARSLGEGGRSEAERWPALAGLMQTSRLELQRRTPSQVVHEGHRYYLQFRFVCVELAVFDAAGAAVPMMVGALADMGVFGHAPGH